MMTARMVCGGAMRLIKTSYCKSPGRQNSSCKVIQKSSVKELVITLDRREVASTGLHPSLLRLDFSRW